MRREPLNLLLSVSVALLSVSALARPKKSTLEPCRAGRFLLPAGGKLIVGDAQVSLDAVVLDGHSVGIDSGCALVAGSVKATKRGTRVTGKWAVCGGHRNVQLRALIAPDCNTMAGTLRAKKVKPSRFAATRSRCGDGVLDRQNDEDCDGVIGCGDGIVCTDQCHCQRVTTTSPRPPTPCVPVSGMFVDCLSTSGLADELYDGGENGAAVADVDGDGFPDVFVWNTAGVARLFRNLGHDMQFESVVASGLVWPSQVMVTAAAFGDLDNDGKPD